MDDRALFGTILALFALLTGNPVVALIIFVVAVL